MTFNVLYGVISEAVETDLVAELGSQNIPYSKIITIIYADSEFHCFYIKSQ